MSHETSVPLLYVILDFFGLFRVLFLRRIKRLLDSCFFGRDAVIQDRFAGTRDQLFGGVAG